MALCIFLGGERLSRKVMRQLAYLQLCYLYITLIWSRCEMTRSMLGCFGAWITSSLGSMDSCIPLKCCCRKDSEQQWRGWVLWLILAGHCGKAWLNILTSTFRVLRLLYFFTLDVSTSLVWILHLLLHPRSVWGSWTALGQVQNFGFPGRSAITGENRDVGCSGCDGYCTDLKHCSSQLCLPLQPNPFARHSRTLSCPLGVTADAQGSAVCTECFWQLQVMEKYFPTFGIWEKKRRV